MRLWRRQTGRRTAAGGVLALAAVVLLLATIFARRFLMREAPTHPLVVVFPQAADFQPGSPVRIAGYPVGVVRAVESIAPGEGSERRVAVKAAIDTTYWGYLRADSEASAETPRLLQRVVVLQLLPGTAASPLLLPGDTLHARAPVSLDDLVDHARGIGPSLDSLIADGRTLERTMRGRNAGLRALQHELERARSELAVFGAGVRNGPLHEFMENPATRDRLERIRTSVQRIGTAVADRRAVLHPAAQRIARRVELVVAEISEIEAGLRERRGAIPRASDDAAILEAVERLRAQIDSLISQLGGDPLRALF